MREGEGASNGASYESDAHDLDGAGEDPNLTVPAVAGSRTAHRDAAPGSTPIHPDLSPTERLLLELREGPAAPAVVAALIAWSITVAPVAFARGTPALAAVLAVPALLAGLVGPLLLRARPRLARHLGISAFLALATATWLVGSSALHPLRLDPARGVLGGVAWGVFALAWSDRWGARATVARPDPDAPLLLARANLPALATPIAAAGVAAALAYLIIAFRVRDPDRALAAQVAALLCAITVVSAAAVIATARGAARSSGGRRITPTVVRTLLLLAAFAVAGAVAATLR